MAEPFRFGFFIERAEEKVSLVKIEKSIF